MHNVRDKLHEKQEKNQKKPNLNMKEYIEYLMTKEKSPQTGK
jgi:hypothetical protein